MSLKSQANKKGQEREAHPEYLEETRPTMLRHTTSSPKNTTPYHISKQNKIHYTPLSPLKRHNQAAIVLKILC